MRTSALLFSISIALAACGSSGNPPADDPDAGPPDPDRPDAMVSSTPDAGPGFTGRLCEQTPPAGAPVPVMPAPPATGCPDLVGGLSSFTSGGMTREFILVLPENPMPDETFPVLFMWHWIGGNANSFLERGEVQVAATEQRFIAVIPVAAGADVFGLDTRWPFDITQSAARMNQEFTFFDDMLACVSAQHPVNTSCVSSIGVSAGALFTDQLAQARSETLASFISLSGGVGATIIKPWTGAARPLPALVLWGGDGPPEQDGVRDILGCVGIGMDFAVASAQLESALIADGHFLIECKHNCGHVEPPLDPVEGQSKYASIWEFALNHPYWLPAGTSPYASSGLPEAMPAWCGVGIDGATPRTGGGCPPGENPCPS